MGSNPVGRAICFNHLVAKKRCLDFWRPYGVQVSQDFPVRGYPPITKLIVKGLHPVGAASFFKTNRPSEVQCFPLGDVLGDYCFSSATEGDVPIYPRLRANNTRAETAAPLKDLLYGPDGAAFSPTHTRKSDRLYRY